jgi:integrase
VKGSVYKRCSCRDPETRKPLGAKCPDLKKTGHGRWYFRHDAPPVPGESKRRRPEVGPFPTRKDAQNELSATLARTGGGAEVADRALRVSVYLEQWLAGKKLRLKPATYDSYEEAVRLYWRPAIGHLRLVELRAHHLQDAVTVMATMINQPLPDKVKPELAELLRRLAATRADDTRRILPEGGQRRKKSVKPLSPARVEREFAVIRAALNDAAPRLVMISPAEGVVLPRVDKKKPLAWTPQREERFRAELDKRIRAAEVAKPDGHVLTTVERQDLWDSPGMRPAPSMVWMPGHAGAFLDYLEESGERLAVLFAVTMFCGFRRDEVLGLTWAEVDLGEGIAYVRATASGTGPKSDAGIRAVPLPGPAADALKAWKKQQAADRLAWGADWPDHGLVFTREDGTPVPAQWTSTRFELLAFRAGLPPVRFHDLRHGTASLMKAAKVDTKFISAMLGHSRTSFTDSQYVTLFPEVQKAAAEAAAAIVPRKSRSGGGDR